MLFRNQHPIRVIDYTRGGLTHPAASAFAYARLPEAHGTRDRYVIRSLLVEPDGQELPQRERIGETPCDAASAVESFEETVAAK